LTHPVGSHCTFDLVIKLLFAVCQSGICIVRRTADATTRRC